ncbi:hypothetical protein JOQ06_001093 [Pogonophryne albipinna]|uniref:Uncharacterized protein n=1 Tax=Pogonophryne albipinna TaxID=1090488 RepID=A0AAD6B573_9TELE|nr:hypothetical protein JOQ06_001093 [Pogonophryne albipinna]
MSAPLLSKAIPQALFVPDCPLRKKLLISGFRGLLMCKPEVEMRGRVAGDVTKAVTELLAGNAAKQRRMRSPVSESYLSTLSMSSNADLLL